ncbi:DUF2071 domain-containing protein [Streptomyces maremycinicus]|uniref:DUF2071 domain-containing protein n=1 Tax=Streptomyces maremycinicus TaxID=1679753 RepID=UPI00078934AF|nr:DUF2071 domain-containing protein [Streptomyces sp. NBRC 110468]
MLFRQRRRDLVFLHWPADPFEVARLLPAGTVPDLHQGRAYVGLVFFRMDDLALGRTPALPYLGSFGEVDVRLYSRDCPLGDYRRRAPARPQAAAVTVHRVSPAGTLPTAKNVRVMPKAARPAMMRLWTAMPAMASRKVSVISRMRL